MRICVYYTASVAREKTWFLVAVLRSYEHVAFDRTLDKSTGLFEFFVPVANEESFLTIMHALQAQGVVGELTKLPNRLADPDAQL